jgi:hypothetical protein
VATVLLLDLARWNNARRSKTLHYALSGSNEHEISLLAVAIHGSAVDPETGYNLRITMRMMFYLNPLPGMP